MPGRVPSRSSRSWTSPRSCFVLVCALALSVFWSGAAAPEEADWPSIATPLRIVNLNPFHLLYGVPGSVGTRVLTPGSSELIASLDMASHLRAGGSGSEQVLIDGETYRQALTLRHGFRDGWEYLLDISVVSHSAGVFDEFIENWHSTFGLPQSNRHNAPRDRLALFYASDGTTHVDLDRGASSLGDVSLGVGFSLPPATLSNDGLAVRSVLKLPTGDEDSLAGSGGFSASVWAETSGALPGSAGSRSWLYAATLGALVGEAPPSLPGLGGRLIAFGRFGVTWRPLTRLALTAQVDAHSSPYAASAVSPLSDAAVMIGLGGTLRLTEHTTLEIAVTEDDGSQHAAPDIGLHIAMRWRM